MFSLSKLVLAKRSRSVHPVGKYWINSCCSRKLIYFLFFLYLLVEHRSHTFTGLNFTNNLIKFKIWHNDRSDKNLQTKNILLKYIVGIRNLICYIRRFRNAFNRIHWFWMKDKIHLWNYNKFPLIIQIIEVCSVLFKFTPLPCFWNAHIPNSVQNSSNILPFGASIRHDVPRTSPSILLTEIEVVLMEISNKKKSVTRKAKQEVLKKRQQ